MKNEARKDTKYEFGFLANLGWVVPVAVSKRCQCVFVPASAQVFERLKGVDRVYLLIFTR